MVTTIYMQDSDATMHVGDALSILATLPADHADCIVTSPPYWAKRDYGVEGQYGHEADPADYIETLRAVFAEARRVLRGLLFCGICQRRMQGSCNNEQVCYRAMFPAEYARTNQVHHPRGVYLREADLITPTHPSPPLAGSLTMANAMPLVKGQRQAC